MAVGTLQQVNIDAVLATIRQMESGGNYTIVTKGGSDACGAYQYVSSTWQSMLYRTIRAGWLPSNTPMYSRACQAPANVQDTVARFDVTTFLPSVSNNVSMVPIHWYYPAAIATWPAMANYTPPGNNISLGAYQANWMKVYQQKAGAGSGGGNNVTNQGNPQVNNNTGIQYTYAQLEQLWINAGGNPQVASIAAAVASAESGGNPNAVSPSNDYGLWQINSVHGAQATLDIMGNARAAVAISNNGQNWGPWCTCWVNPQANCGHFLGPNPQPGSPAAKLIRNNIAPDPNTPVNGTAVATNATPAQQAQDASWFDPQIGACSSVEWFINPGGCGAKQAGSEAQHLAGSVIDYLMMSFLNPLISIIAGVFGMLAGGFIMLIGLWMLIHDTRAGRFTAEPASKEVKLPPPAASSQGSQQQGHGSTTVFSSRTGSGRKKQQKKQTAAQRKQSMREQARKYAEKGAEAGGEVAAAGA
jgi:hypothetical protein